MASTRQFARRALVVDNGNGREQALTPLEAEAESQALSQFVKQLGGKAGLLDTLSIAADSPECQQLVTLLLDPRYEEFSVKQLCHLGNLTLLDLFAAYKKASVAKAHVLAMEKVTSLLLPVVEDVMRRAAPYTIPCTECGATGLVKNGAGTELTCLSCHGHKALIVQPELDRQKVALELAQLLQKGGGVTVQQFQNNAPRVEPTDDELPSGRTSLVDVQRAVREILRGPRPPLRLPTTEPPPTTVVEATLVDPPLTPPADEPV